MPSPSSRQKKKRKSNSQNHPALEDLAKRERELEQREAALEYERLQFKAEKARFAPAGSNNDNDDGDAAAVARNGSDVISLNVGGTRMDVSRRTLTSVVPDSLLAAQFSGRWDDSLSRDADGRVFIDQPPVLFQILIDILRDQSNATPAPPAVRPPDAATFSNDKGTYQAFVRMVQYYGCTHAIWPCRLTFDRIGRQGSRLRRNNSSGRQGRRMRRNSNSGSSANNEFPVTTYFPNMEIMAPDAFVSAQLSPSHHNRYPRVIEMVLTHSPTTSSSTRAGEQRQEESQICFGWVFRSFPIRVDDNDKEEEHGLYVDIDRGMLILDDEDDGDPLDFLPDTDEEGTAPDPSTTTTTIRMEIKQSVFYFSWNGKTIATFDGFHDHARGVKWTKPGILTTCRWRITELVLDA